MRNRRSLSASLDVGGQNLQHVLLEHSVDLVEEFVRVGDELGVGPFGGVGDGLVDVIVGGGTAGSVGSWLAGGMNLRLGHGGPLPFGASGWMAAEGPERLASCGGSVGGLADEVVGVDTGHPATGHPDRSGR